MCISPYVSTTGATMEDLGRVGIDPMAGVDPQACLYAGDAGEDTEAWKARRWQCIICTARAVSVPSEGRRRLGVVGTCGAAAQIPRASGATHQHRHGLGLAL